MKCTQEGCTELASYSFIWPGKGTSFICKHHVYKLKEVAEAMGIHINLTPVAKVNEEENMS